MGATRDQVTEGASVGFTDTDDLQLRRMGLRDARDATRCDLCVNLLDDRTIMQNGSPELEERLELETEIEAL